MGNLSDEAIADADEAVAWYEAQKTGLGFDFSLQLAEMLQKIEETPESQRFLFDNKRYARIDICHTISEEFYILAHPCARFASLYCIAHLYI
jgi:hypothetical protein